MLIAAGGWLVTAQRRAFGEAEEKDHARGNRPVSHHPYHPGHAPPEAGPGARYVDPSRSRSGHRRRERQQPAELALSDRQGREDQKAGPDLLQTRFRGSGRAALCHQRAAAGCVARTLYASARRGGVFDGSFPRSAGVDRGLPRRGNGAVQPHVRRLHLPSGTEHAARRSRPGTRRHPDDAPPAARSGSRGGARPARRGSFVRHSADRLSHGPLWTRQPRPPGKDIVYEDEWGKPYSGLQS